MYVVILFLRSEDKRHEIYKGTGPLTVAYLFNNPSSNIPGLTSDGTKEKSVNVGYRLNGMFLSFTNIPVHCPYWPNGAPVPNLSPMVL
jgi:hypothetical protein